MSSARPVVVGVDGSEQSLLALRCALAEARIRDAPLHVIHCVDVTPAVLHLAGGVTTNTREFAEQAHRGLWEKLAPAIESSGVDVKKVGLTGYPADELADYCAANDADLLVLGTRGRGRIASTVLGSTSLRALEQSSCDILISKSEPTS